MIMTGAVFVTEISSLASSLEVEMSVPKETGLLSESYCLNVDRVIK